MLSFSSTSWYKVSEFKFFVFSSLIILTGVLVVVLSRIILFHWGKRHAITVRIYAIWIVLQLPVWPKYTEENGEVMILNNTCEARNDPDRVFPGDGICPFNKVLPWLYDSGFRGGLSVELFNKGYWETMDVKEVLKKSFEKTTQVINSSMG